jgi:uncharacterized protein
MGNSLIDQLKKTGLVNKSKAHKAKHDQYKHKKQKAKKGAAAQLDDAKLLAQKAQAEKVERDRQINQQHKEEAERKAIAAQIIQLIESNRVEDRDGEIVYNFTDANVVKRIFVSEQIHKHLMSGRLAIAKLGEGYELVPMPVAEKIKQRDAQCIIDNDHSVEAVTDADDPYADYKIPDDLIW